MIGTDAEQLVLATLLTTRMLLKDINYIEYTFLDLFGRDYLDKFDEYDSKLEDLIVSFCRSNRIHCTKTRISYIFSKDVLKFKRKADQKLC